MGPMILHDESMGMLMDAGHKGSGRIPSEVHGADNDND